MAVLADDLAVPYVERGSPDGAPVLMLHGAFDAWQSFIPVLEHLPLDLHALAVTQRGHGDASAPLGSYGITQLAADASRFLDVMGAERAVVVGHSLGSAVALRLAVDAPDRVAGLVLSAAHSAAAHASRALTDLIREVKTLREPLDASWVEALQSQAREPHLPGGLFRAMVQQTLHMPVRVMHELVDELAVFDADADLHRIVAPATLVWGDDDPVFHRNTQEVLLRGLPRAVLRTYPGAGHTPHWSAPRRFAADIAEAVAAARLAGVDRHTGTSGERAESPRSQDGERSLLRGSANPSTSEE